MDYFLTIQGMQLGAVEGNLIANYFIDHNALQYFKLVGVGLLCIYLICAANKDLTSQSRVNRLMWWANLAYSFIAVSNVVVYFVQKYDVAIR